jgi:small redox-active disulfide protein 2
MTAIQVLGLGCRHCDALRQRTRVAAGQLGLDAPVENVEDFAEIVRLGVMSAPALVLDGRVLVAGSVPSVDQVRELLAAAGE